MKPRFVSIYDTERTWEENCESGPWLVAIAGRDRIMVNKTRKPLYDYG